MQHTITSKLFFFNTDTDYLPYYKNYTATMKESQTLADLLQEYKKQIRDYNINTLVSVDNTLMDGSVTIKALVENFGTDLVIEPISVYRATKDLQINNDDFWEKYELLSGYCDQSDELFYKTLQKEYYASSSLKYNEAYYGDALLLLAHRLISKDPAKKETVLKVINDPFKGLSYYEAERNIFPLTKLNEIVSELKTLSTKVAEPTSIEKLTQKIKKKICPPKDSDTSTLKEPKDIDFSTLNLQKSFKEFNIAVYQGPNATDDYKDLLEFVKATEVTFDLAHKASGVDLLDVDKKIASLKAAEIIVDAFDRSADILVVNSETERVHLSSKSTQKAAGREINLQIVTASQLLEIALGNSNKKVLGLDKADITFI
jgi:heterodisulfide reductase subunit B